MLKEKVKVVIIIMILCLAVGTIYKVVRSDTGISSKHRTDSERGVGTSLCESIEYGADEGFAILEKSKDSIASNQTEDIEPMEEATDSEFPYRIYGSQRELRHDRELPYVDETVFEIIKAAYEEVDFEGEFNKGNPDTYEEYREIFQRLVRNEEPYLDTETGEEIYLKDCNQFSYHLTEEDVEAFKYTFYDMEGDGIPELYVWEPGRACAFKYDPKKQKIILWFPGSWGSWTTLIGTGKIQDNFLMKDFYFCQLDAEGEEIFNTLILFEALSDEDIVYLARMPEYADCQEEELTEEMKFQGAIELENRKWYFRITKEQYEELLQPHLDAYETAKEKIKAVTYTYEEFLQ